jgi:iron complex outermembrane recepter protein
MRSRQGSWDQTLRWCSCVSCVALLTPILAAALPNEGTMSAATLKKLSLEELMDLEVTSVSRTQEPAIEAAAAVHVITEEDIRRSGVRSLPEALRLAPNLQVAQAGSRVWAISARGFNASFSNKLLVLIDGRTVYSPLFSGVFWDAQDTMLEDIERIEVISGPGATIWGANAVNGVINVITKRASATQGVLLSAGGGTEEELLGGVRYGGRAAEALQYRVYTKYFARDSSVLASGTQAMDSWHAAQAGFRLDWNDGTVDALTLQGDLYDGNGKQAFAPDLAHSGGNVLARWTRQLDGADRLQVQTYYDHTRQFSPGDFGDELDTFDVDTQYEWNLGGRQHAIAGLGYRFTRNNFDNIPGSIAFVPARLDRHLFSAFMQDEIALLPRMKLIIGSKFEHNDYTGWEVQPTLRATWSSGAQMWWSAVSRAVRTPSRIDQHLFFPANPPFIFAGGPNFRSEELVAYELGWRMNPSESVFVTAAAFFHDYDDIRTISAAPPFVIENNAEGEVYGLELEGTWQPTERVTLRAGYTLLQEDLRVKPGRNDLNAGRGETFDPQQQFQLRGSFNLTPAVEFDAWLRYVDEISNDARGFAPLPDYVTLDLRLGWSVFRSLQVALVGQNLLEDRHPEFGFREIERAAYAKASWRF